MVASVESTGLDLSRGLVVKESLQLHPRAYSGHLAC